MNYEFDLRNYQLVIDAGNRALKLDANSSTARLYMAKAHFEIGNIEEAKRIAAELQAESFEDEELNLLVAGINRMQNLLIRCGASTKVTI